MKPKFDFEYNLLGIYNYNREGKFLHFFQWLKENDKRIDGDIVESGVYKGSSLLAIALYLKEIGSNKKIYGYDSFSGFPPIYSDKDDPKMFQILYKQGKISKKHYEQVVSSKNLITFLKSFEEKSQKNELKSNNISSSLDFNDSSLLLLNEKIKLLELDNVVLVSGSFSESMVESNIGPKSVAAIIMDSDLYASYKITFEFFWPKLAKNGYVFLDEYFSLKFPGARIATDEFIEDKNVKLLLTNPGYLNTDFERWSMIK
ncbi:TylF/MycF/NovP-related O-methyltransferase [Leptospira santarosai]|uniref:TylF/MycF/NovP-related O-methyltransferase n=1 Tax=Leptospira santarosai TaxID=28183 RepID=UPI0024AF2F40|nr:TylF/MycF/NovP-related O-methyltransferase [Leptospira santarosai]MDI7189562.1 TylF/MycF/NovP-related O-methyltransferase [Leptospira santarosai]MDI7211302.1 TylF/MycF/NovP-related O-methyltransferase [Leptospira santarosai]MDI7221748.1 TylF/MycF/NovP-related O-methyltransferase [Leptospira santarosai]